MRNIGSMGFAAFLLVAAAEPPPSHKDPQSSYEPGSAPGAGQKFLSQFVGDWGVVKTFYSRTAAPVRSEGKCRQSLIHGGRFLHSEFEFGEGARKTTGLGLIGFEPESGTFTSVWTDSRQTRMSFRRSRDPFDGQTIVLYSQSLDARGNDSRRSKTVSRLEDQGRRLIHRQYAIGPDGSERLMMELVLTRKASASAEPSGKS